jgi:hypothetical protein
MMRVFEGKKIHPKFCPKTERKDSTFKNQKCVAGIFLEVVFNTAVNSQNQMRLVIDERMTIQHLWSDKDGGKSKQSKKNLSHCHFVHHKYRMDLHKTEPRPQ